MYSSWRHIFRRVSSWDRGRLFSVPPRRSRAVLSRLAHWPGAFSKLRLQAPVVGWVARLGGVIYEGAVKLKNSVMSSLASSRAVSGGKLKRVSMNLRIAV